MLVTFAGRMRTQPRAEPSGHPRPSLRSHAMQIVHRTLAALLGAGFCVAAAASEPALSFSPVTASTLDLNDQATDSTMPAPTLHAISARVRADGSLELSCQAQTNPAYTEYRERLQAAGVALVPR